MLLGSQVGGQWWLVLVCATSVSWCFADEEVSDLIEELLSSVSPAPFIGNPDLCTLTFEPPLCYPLSTLHLWALWSQRGR